MERYDALVAGDANGAALCLLPRVVGAPDARRRAIRRVRDQCRPGERGGGRCQGGVVALRHALQHVNHVLNQVEAVGDLYRTGRALPRAIGERPAAVAAVLSC